METSEMKSILVTFKFYYMKLNWLFTEIKAAKLQKITLQTAHFNPLVPDVH